MSSAVVAVVDHESDAAVVWWIDLGPRPAGMSRMCGAWVLDGADRMSTVADLTASRLVVTTTAGQSFLTRNATAVSRSVDVAGTHAAVVAERDLLQAAFDEAVRTRKNGRALIAPTWPAMIDEIDVDDAHPVAGDPRASRALAIARWFDGLCTVWDGIEEQRLARGYLRVLGGPAGRPLPVVYRAGHKASAA